MQFCHALNANNVTTSVLLALDSFLVILLTANLVAMDDAVSLALVLYGFLIDLST
jgi:hypothetical protein